MKVLPVMLLCALWLVIGVMIGQCSPQRLSSPPTPALATSVAGVGSACISALDNCVSENARCIDTLKQAVGKADDYLTILEKVSGKNLHNLPKDAGSQDW
jgi:hypothetical protein